MAGIQDHHGGGRRTRVAVAFAAVTILAGGGLAACQASRKSAAVIVGATDATTSTPPTVAIIPQEQVPLPKPDIGRPPLPEPGRAVGLKVANGRPFRPAIEFRSSIPIPEGLVFIVVMGSDARPNEDLVKTRADSLHLVAVNPASGQGTVVGIPRDAYVEFANGGRGKINDALARGGPQNVAATVRKLTGLPIHYWVLTGFVGLQKMVDELGGVDVHVDRRMNDKNSGARFDPGWHHFNGGEALAFSRNRTDVAYGDFSRSENQGLLILGALAKMRSEVADDNGIAHWLNVLGRHVRLDVPAERLPGLAAMGRRIDPTRMANLVLPGKVGYAGKASVVYLTADAPRLFADLRDDAVIGTAEPATTTVPPPTTTTTTTAAPSTTVVPSPTTTSPSVTLLP